MLTVRGSMSAKGRSASLQSDEIADLWNPLQRRTDRPSGGVVLRHATHAAQPELRRASTRERNRTAAYQEISPVHRANELTSASAEQNPESNTMTAKLALSCRDRLR